MSEGPYITERLETWKNLETDANLLSTLGNIERYGWEAMLISSSEQASSFAYTVGLHDVFGFPEIIVVGLKTNTAHHALGYAVKAMRAGVDLTVGRHREIVGEVEVEFRPVSSRWYKHVMCRADWYYNRAEIPALQLIYPDMENRFQWEEGFTEYFHQPMLAADAIEGVAEKDFWSANDPESSLFDWKFPDPPHTRVYLSQTVQDKEEAVTYVSHDVEDGAWQFLGDKMADGGGPVISCFHHPVDDDPTLKELYDLPLGWYATRDTPTSPWRRFEHKPGEDEEVAENPPPPLLN